MKILKKLILPIVIVITVSMGIVLFVEFQNQLIDLGVSLNFINIEEKEQPTEEIVAQERYRNLANQASYVITEKDKMDGLLNKIISTADDKFKEKLGNTQLDYYTVNNEYTQLIQNGLIDKNEDVTILTDTNGTDNFIKDIDANVLKAAQLKIFNNFDVMYPEQFIKPLPFDNDYMRVRYNALNQKPFREDTENVVERNSNVNAMYDEFEIINNFDENGKKIATDYENSLVYSYVYRYIDNKHYQDENDKKQIIEEYLSYPSDEKYHYYNRFGVLIKNHLVKVYYEVDKQGEPILDPLNLDGSPFILDELLNDDQKQYIWNITPTRDFKAVHFSDLEGNLQVNSIPKINIKTEKTKELIWDDDIDGRQLEEMLFVESEKAIRKGESNIYSQGKGGYGKNRVYTLEFYNKIKDLYEDQQFQGTEGVEWKYNYKNTQSIPIAKINSNGDLELQVSKEDFRYHFKNNKKIDTGIMNIEERYAWDLDKNRPVYMNQEIMPLIEKSVKDYGLGNIFKFHTGLYSYEYPKMISYKEDISRENSEALFNEWFSNLRLEGYDVNFTWADFENGNIPAKFVTNEFIDHIKNKKRTAYLEAVQEKYINFELLKDVVDEDMNFLGDDEFNNKKWNEAVEIHTPTINGLNAWYNNASKKDQFYNPEKYYISQAMLLEEKRPESEFFNLPSLGFSTSLDITDNEVNNIDWNNYSYNKKINELREKIDILHGEYNYVSKNNINPLTLVSKAITQSGTYNFTYDEKESYTGSIPESMKTAILNLNEYNKYFIFKGWDVKGEFEVTTYKKKRMKIVGVPNSGYDVWEKKTKDVTRNLINLIPSSERRMNVYFYQLNEPTKSYDESDMDRIILEDGYPNKNFRNAVDVKVPVINNIDDLSFEEGEKETSSYRKEELLSITFTPKFETRLDSGSFFETKKLYDGAMYTTEPVLNQQIIGNELLGDFKQRLNMNGLTNYQAENVQSEHNYLFQNLETYLRFLEFDIPLKAESDKKAFERASEKNRYWELATSAQANAFKTDPYLNQYEPIINNFLKSESYKGMFGSNLGNGMNINQKEDYEKVSRLILALLTIENTQTESFRYGEFNIKFDRDILNSADYYNGSQSIAVGIKKDSSTINQLEYVLASIHNLTLKNNGNVLDALFEYHIGSDAFEHLKEASPQTYGKRTQEEILLLANKYNFYDEDFKSLDNLMIEHVLSSLKSSEDMQTVLNTSTKFYEEWYENLRDSGISLSETKDEAMMRIFGDGYQSRYNQAINHYKAYQTEEEIDDFIRFVLAEKRGEEYLDEQQSVFNFLDYLQISSFLNIVYDDISDLLTMDLLNLSEMKALGQELDAIPNGEGQWTREEMFEFSKMLLKTPYHWGGMHTFESGKDGIDSLGNYFGTTSRVIHEGHQSFGKNVISSTDCSGFVYLVNKKGGYDLHRLTATGYYNKWRKYEVPLANAQLMDIAYRASSSRMKHIGFVVGYSEDGIPLYIHQSSTKYGVIIGISSFTHFTQNPYFVEQ